MSTISRRAFLKTVGVGALSVAAMSVLAGCEGLPTGNDTGVVAGSVKGTAGVVVPVDSKYTVLLDASDPSITNGEFALTADSWATTYKNGFKTVVAKTPGGSGATEYSSATVDQINDAIEAGLDAVAEAELPPVKEEFTVNIANYSDSMIVLAQSVPSISSTDAKDLKSNTSVITATCDGKEVACHVDTASIAGNDLNTTGVTCTIAVPANTDKIVLKVAIPGASKAVVYELANSNYMSMADCKAYQGD